MSSSSDTGAAYPLGHFRVPLQQQPECARLCVHAAGGDFPVGFLTYPLGLGVWLSFTDTRIGQAGDFIGLENYCYLHGRQRVLAVGVQYRRLHRSSPPS